MQDHFVILDIRGLVIHALHMGEDTDGQPHPETGKMENSAGYGFSNFFEVYLEQILDGVAPRRVIAVWEGGNQHRKNFFPQYKQKRSERTHTDYSTEQHGELTSSVKALLSALGVTHVSVKGAEADDVIAYLCNKLPGSKLVYTRDKDLSQLLQDERVQVMYMNELVDRNYRSMYCNVVQSLLGDQSDEYPGISGFGEKKLEAILNEFGEDTLYDLAIAVSTRDHSGIEEALATAADPNTRKGLELILGNWKQWELMYYLACLHPELCEGQQNGEFRRLEWVRRLPDRDTVMQILSEYDMLHKLGKIERYLPTFTLVTADNLSTFEDHLGSLLDETPFFAFDFESYDALGNPAFNIAKKSGGDYVDVLSQSITGCSICYGDNLQHVAYISCDHAETNNVPDTAIEGYLKELYAEHKPLIAHNAPFELALCDTNFLWTPLLHDTAVMARYVDENDSARLKDLSKRWFGYKQETYAEVLEKAQAANMREVTGEQVMHYGCDDSLVTAALYDLFYLILNIENTWEFIRDNEFSTNNMLHEAFESGIRIDLDHMKVLEQEDAELIERNITDCRAMLAEHCGTPDPDRAQELINDLAAFEEAKMVANGKSRDQINDKIASITDRLQAATQYLPLITHKKSVEFIPTAKQITGIAQRLGIEGELTGVTAGKITEYRSTLIMASPELAAQAEAFLDLLGATGTELRKREGEAFEAFNQFCIDLLERESPDVTEGDELNMDSPAQMQQLFYCKLGLPIRVYGKVTRGSARDKLNWTGAPSTDDKAIDFALAQDAREGDWRREFLLKWKDMKSAHTRMKNYWRPYPLWIHPRDGMLHGSVTNAATTTHRFTAGDPNLLAIPSRDGGRVRSVVLPKKDTHVILSPDFNGEELRITASLSQDPVMVDAYIGNNPRDLHTITAAAISGTLINRERPDLAEQLEFTYLNGLPTLDYEVFKELHDNPPDKETGTFMKNIRKLAKNCIAEGSPVLTERGLVPIEDVKLSDRVWDGVEWVTHSGVICKGIRNTIHYDGVWATPDHEVFLNDGRKISIREAANEPAGPGIADGAIGSTPVRFDRVYTPRSLGGLSTESHGPLHALRHREVRVGGQLPGREVDWVPLSPEEIHRPEASEVVGALQCDAPALLQQAVPLLQELRGEGGKGFVQIPPAFHRLGDGESATQELHRSSDRQDQQRRALQAREFEAGYLLGEQLQQAHESQRRVQGDISGQTPSMAFNKNGSSGVPVCICNGSTPSIGRDDAGGDNQISQAYSRRQKVYDIVNAGPRHRFTVSGKIVSNCNFLLVYCGSAPTLARNIGVPVEDADIFLQATLATFAELVPWQQRSVEFARDHGYVLTAWGNRRHLGDGLFDTDAGIRTRLERQAVNAQVQSAGADIMKVVCSTLLRDNFCKEYGASGIIFPYDELAFSVPRETAWDAWCKLKEVMTITPPGHLVPQLPELKASALNWGTCVELGAHPTRDELESLFDKQLAERNAA